jgi:hypothetical protein
MILRRESFELTLMTFGVEARKSGHPPPYVIQNMASDSKLKTGVGRHWAEGL